QLAAKGAENIQAVIQEPATQGYIVSIPAEGEGAGASLSVANYDRYSVNLRHLEVFDNSLPVAQSETENYLRHCATILSQRLIYLEEPLALLELNTVDGIAQLRSSPPDNGNDQSTYWEVTVWTSPKPRAKLARYRWTAGTPERTPITYPATFATLGRLSEDLAVSLSRQENR
ncbi:MAG: hypothetical protein GY792_23380, partial [Gammaproteobacteria bacterium]|nr:hypothetical protein [Gammaproteobacteria bacterium]